MVALSRKDLPLVIEDDVVAVVEEVEEVEPMI